MARITASNWRQFVGTTWRMADGRSRKIAYIYGIFEGGWDDNRCVLWDSEYHQPSTHRRSRYTPIKRFNEMLKSATQTGGEPVKEPINGPHHSE